MKNNFSSHLAALQKSANSFDDKSNTTKNKLITALSAMILPGGKLLLQYHDLLLFFCAYPGNARLQQLAEKELKRIASYCKKHKASVKTIPENEGLPFANIITRFSPDFLQWLLQHKDVRVAFDSFNNPTLSLNDVLNITLPAVLKAETTAGLENEELLALLHIKPDDYAPFLLGQLNELNDNPLLKELFMERVDMYVKLVPKNMQFSRAYNRIPVTPVYYHQDLKKQFDPSQLFAEPLSPIRIPGNLEKQQVLKAVKNAMALTVREIDPATFLEVDTIRLFELERGLTLSVYSMYSQRQLPLETYFGFTFFKNGIPISYGGIWAFGRMAKIGLNIFEPFRGGESGYILCQLLRVLKQAFGVSYVEIEPYQFGLDNPDGIKSGAFWFYHKYGFTPVDAELKKLARTEHNKIKTRKNYRSSEKTLLRFTESNIGINLGGKLPVNVTDLTTEILKAIQKNWPHNYKTARADAIGKFCKSVKLDVGKLTVAEIKVLEEIALWAMAMGTKKKQQLQLMKKMVFAKTKDDYTYQQLLLAYFKE